MPRRVSKGARAQSGQRRGPWAALTGAGGTWKGDAEEGPEGRRLAMQVAVPSAHLITCQQHLPAAPCISQPEALVGQVLCAPVQGFASRSGPPHQIGGHNSAP